MTPQWIVLIARWGGSLLLAVGALLGLSGLVPDGIGSGASIGYATALIAQIALPRVRRSSALAAALFMSVGIACCVGWSTAGTGLHTLAGVLAGVVVAMLPLHAARVRRLAAANPHMSFAEWKRIESRQQRRRGDREAGSADRGALIALPAAARDEAVPERAEPGPSKKPW